MPRALSLAIAMIVAAGLRAQNPALESRDWPTYQHDNRRTGVSKPELKFPLELCWTYKARHAPSPA